MSTRLSLLPVDDMLLLAESDRLGDVERDVDRVHDSTKVLVTGTPRVDGNAVCGTKRFVSPSSDVKSRAVPARAFTHSVKLCTPLASLTGRTPETKKPPGLSDSTA